MRSFSLASLSLTLLFSTSFAEEPAPAEDWQIIPLTEESLETSWKRTLFGGEGEVFINSAAELEFDFGSPMTGVTWQGEPPFTPYYELELEGRKLSGIDFFLALTFPIKDSHASLILGGWGGGVVGISNIDGLSAAENETTSFDGFPDAQWVDIRVRVSPDRLQVWLDGEERVNVETEGKEFALRAGDIELAKPFGLTSFETRSSFRNLRWRPIAGAGSSSQD